MTGRVLTATRMGMRDQLRRPVLIGLMIAIPVIFILWGAKVTAEEPRDITLVGGWGVSTNMRILMTIVDVPVAIAFLSGLVGVFVVSAALQGDRRLVISGYSPRQAILPRLAVLGAGVLVIALVSLIVGAFVFTPEHHIAYLAGNLFTGLEYAAIGALAGAFMGRLGAIYFIFFLPNVDIGIVQDPLFFSGHPQWWAAALPGYGPTRLILAASFNTGADMLVPLLISLAWLVVLGAALVLLLERAVAPRT
ncbi:MAG TPA: hypothetical protein VE127_07250 [Solirubrobacteraceae bacterium]|jgi:hypothetical protein|nr:hypothetical protein [Solirubrobacteraceae bacterium]